MQVVKFSSDADGKRAEAFKIHGQSYQVDNSDLADFVKEAQRVWGLKTPDYGLALQEVMGHFSTIGWINSKTFEQVCEMAFKMGAKQFYELFNSGHRDFFPVA